MANDAQREFWNGPAGDVWVEAQERMDAMLGPISDVAVQAAALGSNEHAIDVGCGCGATTLALASSGARVLGVDISEPMVARARDRASGSDRITFEVADAAGYAFEPVHDLLFSRFGVMFFEDPKFAFANLRRALSSGGRMVFACWQSPRENLFMSVAGRAARPFMPEGEPQDPRAPGPFAFADKDWVHEILAASEFRNIEIEPVNLGLTVGQTVDEAMVFQARVGPLARALSELDEVNQQKAKDAVRAALEPFATDIGVVLPSATWLVTATA